MRINHEDKTMDMEARDMNYTLPAYVRNYLFNMRNEMPKKIIFPMFPSVKVDKTDIPIEYVPYLDPVAMEIAEDGSNVAEVTSAQEAVMDEKDEEIKKLKAEVESLAQTGRGEEERGGKQTEQETTPESIGSELAKESGITDKDNTEPPISPARAAFKVDPDPSHQPPPDREPKQPPGGDIGTGMPLSDMTARDRRDQRRTARDLKDEPDVQEGEEKDFEKTVSRGEDGKPVVEDKDE